MFFWFDTIPVSVLGCPFVWGKWDTCYAALEFQPHTDQGNQHGEY